LVICDVSPLFCPKGGGIRTYHRQKIEWFRRQDEHRYLLITPGPRFRVERIGQTVTVVDIFGPPVTSDPDSYRLMIDLARVCRVIRESRADVLEAHDCWISGPLILTLTRCWRPRPVRSMFCHTEPVESYIRPWLRRARVVPAMSRRLADGIGRGLCALCNQFDVTMVASELLRARLAERGVRNTVRIPFGIDPLFVKTSSPSCSGPCGQRSVTVSMLYAGRLDDDKDIGLLIDALPSLLARPDVRITIAGTGRYRTHVERLRHPRLSYVGYVSEREHLRRLYDTHQILLAPGRFETFGLAALEATTAGLVVVGPDEGGTCELLRRIGSPFIFRAGDQESFRNMVFAAIDAPREHLAGQGIVAARAMYGTWAEAIARQVHEYQRLVSQAAMAGRS
jgi:alpha-1,6-mannosyltransferase